MARENFSRKRVAILETLASTKVHPTAEWVYQELKPHYTDLSLGTVYRNIKKFCNEDKVRSVGVINGQEHFDGDVSPHAHFVCSQCGSILDIEESFMTDDIKNELAQRYGFTIVSDDIMFKGVCEKCKNKKTQ